jgi:CoA:oxalate CoA-transferase
MDVRQALSGVKVVAVTRVVAAPFAAYQLAMHGANVITVEDPRDGDSMRSAHEFDSEFLRQKMARVFLSFNSNKRSMTLRFNVPEGREVFLRMIRDADVVIENLRGGAMARYGIGYQDLRKINPRIIFASITGYGQTGPKRNDPAIDGAVQAGSGLMSITGTPESGPLKTGSPIVDYVTGYVTAFSIALALHQRNQTGEGQEIDVSMLEAAMTIMSGEVVKALTGAGTPPLSGNALVSGNYVSDTFSCKEGAISVAAVPEPLRAKFWKAIGREDMPNDPRFCTPAGVRENKSAFNAEITRTLTTKTAYEWEEILNKAGVAAMAVRKLEDAVVQDQLLHRKFFYQFDADPETGLPAFSVPTSPFRMSGSPVWIKSSPPRLGQHTEEVLREHGYSDEDIRGLREKGIV